MWGSGTSCVFTNMRDHWGLQSHIGVLETSPENQTALLMGLEYLIGISYVDDTEVFKVCVVTMFMISFLALNYIVVKFDIGCVFVLYLSVFLFGGNDCMR